MLSQHDHHLGNLPQNALQNSGLNAQQDRNKMADRKQSLWECFIYNYKTCFGIEKRRGKVDVLINVDIVFSLFNFFSLGNGISFHGFFQHCEILGPVAPKLASLFGLYQADTFSLNTNFKIFSFKQTLITKFLKIPIHKNNNFSHQVFLLRYLENITNM